MAENLGNLVAKISTDTTEFSKGLKGAAKELDGFKNAVTNTLKIIGVAFTVHEVVEFGKKIIDLGDELNRLSLRTGLAASQIAQLRFVASQSDTSIEALTDSFRFLAKNMDEAARGNEKAIEVFKRFHIEFKNSDGTLRNYNDVLLEVADRVKNTADQTTVYAATQQLLGKSSGQLIPLLKEGADGIKKLEDRYKALGGDDNKINNFAKQADELKDSWDEVSKTFEIVGIQIMTELVPHIQALGKALILVDWKGFVEDGIALTKDGIAIIRWFDELTTRVTGLAVAMSLIFDKGATFEDLKIALDMIKTGTMPQSTIPPPAPGAGPNPLLGTNPVLGGSVSNVQSSPTTPGAGQQIDPAAKMKETENAMTKLFESWKDINKQITDALAETLTAITDGFGSAMADVIVDGKDFGEAMTSLWKDIAKQVIAEIVAMIAKLMILFVWQTLTGTQGSGKAMSKLFAKDGAAIGTSARNGMLTGANGFATTGHMGESGIPAIVHPGEIISPIDKFFDAVKKSGGNTYQITVNGNQDPQALAQLLALEIDRQRRSI